MIDIPENDWSVYALAKLKTGELAESKSIHDAREDAKRRLPAILAEREARRRANVARFPAAEKA